MVLVLVKRGDRSLLLTNYRLRYILIQGIIIDYKVEVV